MPPAPRGPAHTKPAACRACSLASRGHGFVPPEGPENAPIVWWGEAPGYDEAALGRPFIGAAGSMMERILRRNRIGRGFFRIANILSCVPPQLQLEGMDFQHTAIHHCGVHRAPVHAEPHQVYMAAGATPLKTLLNLHGEKRIRVEEFHGTVNWSDEYQRWVVPTFHPSYLQRGAHNLLGIVSFDLQTALDVAYGKWTPQPMDLVIDPDPEWWDLYVETTVQAARQDPQGVLLACDMETPDKAGGKPENELGPDDASYQIDRWNFATHPDEGVTIPNHPRFRAGVEKLLALKCPHLWWNGSGYDWDRMFAAGYQVDLLSQYDLMLGAHFLQSDVPLGLGFWAPFYSRFGPWKHLSAIAGEEARYACIDGPQTYRVGAGVIGDLLEQGQWRAFQEDCHELLHLVLKPAQQIGVKIDKPALEEFHRDLEVKQRRLLHEIQAAVPDALRPLTGETAKPPKEGVVHTKGRAETLKGVPKADAPDPIKQELFALGAVRVALDVTRVVLVCQTCGQAEVQKRHRCKDEQGRPRKDVEPVVLPEDRLVVRWFWKEPFNPDSPKQMLAYLQHRKHTPGKNKKTKLDSVDRETLARLAKSTGDPFYQANLDYRAVKKVDSTYAIPTLRRIEKDSESRLHPIATFRPSTMRLSYVAPNITNVVGDKGGKENLAAGFRRCVVAAPGCTLAEFDFSGIEAVETGWYARAPHYVRLARLGIHAYLASHLLGRPADLSWSDADLLAYFGELKKAEGWVYDQAKRTVHGTNYGMTPYAMAMMFPHLYKDVKAAERVQAMYFAICPEVPLWQNATRARAYDTGKLGGEGDVVLCPTTACYEPGYQGPSPWPHPFQYTHYFWSVIAYKKIETISHRMRLKKLGVPMVEMNGVWFQQKLGEDAKRCSAFYPQSTAAGVLKRSMRALFAHPDHPSYIGDAYYGKTPLRAPIHDSLLLEIPNRGMDRVVECVAREMLRPVAEQPLPAEWGMGTHLAIGVEAKAGKNWKDVSKLEIPTFAEALGGHLTEETYFGVEESDEEDAADFRVA